MKKTAFLTVVYPGCENYIIDFLGSIKSQSVSCFDLFVFNDGVDDLNRWLKGWNGVTLFEVDVKGLSPVAIRQYAINHIIDLGYDSIVFGDSDDCFSNNRVEESMRQLEKYDVVVNDLEIIDSNKKILEESYLSGRFNDLDEVFFSDIETKNFMGLSNTAINVNKCGKVTFPSGLIAVDWYLYSCVLFNGARAVFTGKAVTKYRQHDSNTVGINSLTLNSFSRGINVKKVHYMNMAGVNKELYGPLYEKYERIEKSFKDESLKLGCYEGALKSQTSSPLWWEGI